MKENNKFRRWLLTINGLQYGTPYDGFPVGNIPKLIHLDNILNRYILHCLSFHCILSLFVLDGKGKEMNMRFNLSTLK